MSHYDLERLRKLIDRFIRYRVEGAEMLQRVVPEIERLQAEAVHLRGEVGAANRRLNDLSASLMEAATEITRLKRGDFTPEEWQNLCHNRHEQPGGCSRETFVQGCLEFQRKLFGDPTHEELSRLADDGCPNASQA